MTDDPQPSTEPLPIPSIDRMQMVQVFRECAAALEKGHGNLHEICHAVGTELMVLALKYRPPEVDGPDPEVTEVLVRREIGAILDTILQFHRFQLTEREVLNERLMRVFDPYLAWNESVNRAIEQKKAKGEAILVQSPQQKFAFENMQMPATRKALFNAGLDDPQPTVHRISGMIDVDGGFTPDASSSIRELPKADWFKSAGIAAPREEGEG